MKFSCILRLAVIGAVLFGSWTAKAAGSLPDSLRSALSAAGNEKSRIALLLNLSDLSAPVEEGARPYCFRLYDAAKNAHDCFALAAALPSVVIYYLDHPDKNPEMPGRYLDEAEQMLSGSAYDGVTDYYRMTLRARELQAAPCGQKAAVCERLMAFYDARRDRETAYERAERLFMSGVIAYQLLVPNSPDAITAGLPYWEEEWQLLKGFDRTAQRLFAGNLIGCMTLAYNAADDAQQFIRVSDEYLSMLDAVFADPEFQKRRPCFSKEPAYLICYQGLINGGRLIGQEQAHNYYLRYRRFVLSDDGSDGLLRDNTFYYSISRAHYTNRGEYEAALAYCDSLIRWQEQGGGIQSGGVVSNYTARAGLLRALGRDSEACVTYERAVRLSDSLSQNRYLDKVGEMEAKFGVEKLEAAMLADRRRNQLMLMFVVLFIAAGAGCYLYFSLRRERRLKEELRHQCEVAQECDRMKTTFLNMMGHEIRTPLNVISGFAEVLATGTIPASQQGEYLVLMQEHARMLTSLMEDMMEVSNLDSCSDELPREEVSIGAMLHEMKACVEADRQGKPIVCRVELPSEPIVVQTNPGYLQHVFHELVKNAVKFTESGTITLGCSVNPIARRVVCTVSDTGIGVPKDKSEAIFDRFMQLDTFVQGIGLGLHLCRLILRKLDGTIAVDTSYTDGLRMVVTLPLTESERKQR